MLTKLNATILTTMILVMSSLAFVPAAEAATACSGHTDADRKSCTATCSAGHKLGVYMDLDDSSEVGSATTSCSNQTASCNITAAQDSCGDESAGSTAASGGWTCYFEAHDVWWQPDNGFTYNCYSYTFGGFAALSVSSVRTMETCSGEATALLAELCTGLALGDGWVAHAEQQIIVRVKDGVAAGISCDATSCWTIEPTCRTSLSGYVCQATPART